MLQSLIVLALILAAAAYLGVGFLKTFRSARAARNGTACGSSSCGCSDH